MKNYHIFLSLALFFGSCNLFQKSEDNEPWFKPPEVTELPPETQTGANTFGCYIDGKPWVPYGVNALSINIVNDSVLYINTNRSYRGHNTRFAFEMLNFKSSPNSYQLAYVGQLVSVRYADFSNENDGKVYTVTSTCEGVLTITRIDKIERIISGRFYFTATDGQGDTVRVTGGRFDKRY